MTAIRDGIRAALRDTGRVAHSGLLLSRYLMIPVKQEPQARVELHHLARTAGARNAIEIYKPAFGRRQQWLKDLGVRDQDMRPLEVRGRLIVGLGRASPLETGISLHHTYGVPIIPGSGLKGLAAHYCDQVWGAMDEKFRRGFRTKRDGTDVFFPGPHETLFGTTDEAGHVTFHDAWIEPACLESETEGLVPDIMTPHHEDYYGGKRRLPTDFDDPVPIPFLSVRGTFHFALSVDDPSELGSRWLDAAWIILTEALQEWGVGGKTSSGYGRFGPPKPEHGAATSSSRSQAHPSSDRQPHRESAESVHVAGSVRPTYRPQPKREWVTLLSVPKNGMARVRTEQGEEIPCDRVPSYPPAREGERYRAAILREGGRAIRASFKSWR
jgi:CRISPR-associated protein Cmr6